MSEILAIVDETDTDEQLVEYEITLYEMEVGGIDTWEQRDEVLWEMNRRGLMRRV